MSGAVRVLRTTTAAILLAAAGEAMGQARDAAVRTPLIFASPINAGCKTFNARTCQIVVEPVTINIASGQRLVAYQIAVDGTIVYDWKSDQSNPPSGPTYSPSRVAWGFGVTCGKTHAVSLYGRDSGDASMFVLGSTSAISCPPPVSALLFYPLPPCRVVDTRNASGPAAGAPALGPGETRVFATNGKCGIPPAAAAISANAVVTGPSAAGNFILYAADQTLPGAYSLTFSAGQTRACQNMVGLAVDASGFRVTNNSAGSAHFILDVNGYYE